MNSWWELGEGMGYQGNMMEVCGASRARCLNVVKPECNDLHAGIFEKRKHLRPFGLGCTPYGLAEIVVETAALYLGFHFPQWAENGLYGVMLLP